MNQVEMNRPLSVSEMSLARWMLKHGEADGWAFLPQLETAGVTAWRCPCGCASLELQIQGHPPAPPGVHILGDFLCGPEEAPAGIFIYESAGLLSGIEVYGLAGDAPTELPHESTLRPLASA